MKVIFILFFLLVADADLFAQDEYTTADKLVYVKLEGYERNYIVIPNHASFNNFKIYRKLKGEQEFRLIDKKNKPLLPVSNDYSPYAVFWTDPDSLSRNIEYKILAFDKDDKQLCEMEIIWEKEKKGENHEK
jgi:hypothetical protein